MKPLATIGIYAALAAGAVVAVSVLFGGADDGVPVAAYVAALGAVGIGQVLRGPGRRWRVDNRPVAPLVGWRPRAPGPPVPGTIIELEGLLAEGAHGARAANLRLRPRLAEVARGRLLALRGIRLDEQPEQAAAILGPDAWEVVRPDPARSTSTTAAGLDPDHVEVLVRRLEEL